MFELGRIIHCTLLFTSWCSATKLDNVFRFEEVLLVPIRSLRQVDLRFHITVVRAGPLVRRGERRVVGPPLRARP